MRTLFAVSGLYYSGIRGAANRLERSAFRVLSQKQFLLLTEVVEVKALIICVMTKKYVNFFLSPFLLLKPRVFHDIWKYARNYFDVAVLRHNKLAESGLYSAHST